MTHLRADEFIDAVDGVLAPARRTHLDTCESCRREAETLAAVLSDVKAVNIDEPSPLFWDHFAGRVRMAVDAERVTAARQRRWFEWPVLAPVSALALLVLALVWSVPQRSSEVAPVPAAAAIAETPGDAAPDVEEQWAMVLDLVGDVDLDAAVESGFIGRLGMADAAVRHLSPDEQLELMRLLRQELRTGG